MRCCFLLVAYMTVTNPYTFYARSVHRCSTTKLHVVPSSSSPSSQPFISSLLPPPPPTPPPPPSQTINQLSVDPPVKKRRGRPRKATEPSLQQRQRQQQELLGRLSMNNNDGNDYVNVGDEDSLTSNPHADFPESPTLDPETGQPVEFPPPLPPLDPTLITTKTTWETMLENEQVSKCSKCSLHCFVCLFVLSDLHILPWLHSLPLSKKGGNSPCPRTRGFHAEQI